MGFSIASFYGFKRYESSRMKNQQKLKTEYSIKIADLSDISNLNISASLKRKIEKIGTYEECKKDKENESLSAFLKKIDNK